MTAFETAMVAAVRAVLPTLEAGAVYWRDEASAWREEISVALSYVSRTSRGKDVRTLGTVTDGSAPETIRGNRVDVVQVTVDANTVNAAVEIADVIKAGIVSSECEALFEAVNVSAARPGAIRPAPYRSDHGDVRSAAVLEVTFNATRKVVVGLVPILAAVEITGEVTPGPITVGPGEIPVP